MSIGRTAPPPSHVLRPPTVLPVTLAVYHGCQPCEEGTACPATVLAAMLQVAPTIVPS